MIFQRTPVFRTGKRSKRVPLWRGWLLPLLAVMANGALFAQAPPRNPERPWLPPAFSRGTVLPDTPQQEVALDGSRVYSLGDLIDLAESNNPRTRLAWSQAKARAATVGIARSELYPTLSAVALGRTFQDPVLLYSEFQLQDIGLIKTMLQLHYTVLDFGARSTEIDVAKARLLAANFQFNDTHLQVIYEVTKSYYALQNAIGLREAAAVSVKDATAVQDAVQERYDNGLATLPDVLAARAALAQAQYDLQNAIRNEQVSFGDLATTLTARPTQPFRIQNLDDLQIPDSLGETEDVEASRAMRQRPDLLARVSELKAANAELKHAGTSYYPSIEFEGNDGWLRAWGQQERLPSIYGQVKVYDAQLTLRWTIFDGLKRENEVRKARAEQEAARAEIHERQDRIADEVWKAYRDAETSFQQRQAAVALLKASSESYDAALEAYKYGVRNILDVLSAERQLAQARAADVTARSEVLNTIQDLAFRTGDLLTLHPTGNHP